jgi:hypothetical protein
MPVRFAHFGGLVLLCTAGCAASGKPAEPASAPVAIRLSPTTYERLGPALRSLPDITTKTVSLDGSLTAVKALQSKEVDLAIVMADTAYHAHVASGADRSAGAPIRGVAVLNVNTVYLAVNPNTRIEAIEDLPGRRVWVGSSGTAATAIANLLLQSSGVRPDRIKAELTSQQDALKHLKTGELDAAFLTLNAAVHTAATEGARLISIRGEWIESLRQQYPFLQNVLVPAGTFPGQRDPLETVGVDLLLACRGDLDDDVVYRLAKAYFDGLQRSAPTTDLERAPATPIPLHPGAARYYRERALSR